MPITKCESASFSIPRDCLGIARYAIIDGFDPVLGSYGIRPLGTGQLGLDSSIQSFGDAV